jgi:hypothetical protein
MREIIQMPEKSDFVAGILGVLGVSVTVVTTFVVVPTLLSSGYVEETIAGLFILIALYIIYRTFFGEEDAAKHVEK